ncbi:ABC transporter substrate-binding protein [Aeromicrobium sp.]|uniref:ABC transporter substrate-binding protein n=1 Tax=Aeromicrobium sp. TaxID=1871063 RepID=UPI003D6A222C
MKTRRVLVAVAACTTLVLGACSDKSTSGGGAGGVKTDKGVTDTEITLGALTDISGPFQQLGKGVVDGHEIWADEVNQAGGICDRDIKLEVRDHGYKADAGVVQFQEIEPNVAGFIQILGSPINAAIDQRLVDSKATAVALSWSSFILKNPYIVIPGTTYDVEMINGLSYLLDEKKIAEGDTIGFVYLEGEYGENGLLGAKYFAEQHDIDLKAVKVVPTDNDLRNVVTGFKGDGVKAIGLTTTPAQTLSVATVSKQLGLDVPLVGNNPTFAPAILTDKTAPALENFYGTFSSVPYSSDLPKAQEVAAAYEEAGIKDAPNGGVPYGYAIGLIWGQILEKACDDGDLTREGIQKAFRASTDIGTEELIADLDFSEVGTPATREVYIAQPDASQDGGLRQVGPLFVSPDAESYKAPEEK